MLNDLDATTRQRIDIQFPMRCRRSCDVCPKSGVCLVVWHDATPAPLLTAKTATCITLNAPKDWLNARIETRFDQMLEHGALDEAAKMLPRWDPKHLSAKAIGAPELIAHLHGEMSLHAARDAAIIASRQYAKRQRTWFRARHKDWYQLPVSHPDISATLRFSDSSES